MSDKLLEVLGEIKGDVKLVKGDMTYVRAKLDGNGQPGIIADVAGVKLQVKVLWAIAACIGAAGASALFAVM